MNCSISVWRNLVFKIDGRSHLWSLYVGERFTAKNCCPVGFLSVVSKVFDKLVNDRLVDHLEKCGFYFYFQYGFRFSCSSTGLLTVLELQDLVYRKLLARFCMLVFFTNLSLTECQLRYLALFCLFSVIDSLEWLIGSLYKNI